MHFNFNCFLSNILFTAVITITFCCCVLGNLVNFSNAERLALQKFRPFVENILTHDYMKDDIYLVKFLRGKNLDVDAATDFLRNAIHWRKQNNIDNILNENFSEVFKSAPYWMNGIDKEGSPILIINNGRWDIRKFALSGNRLLLTRHWDQMLERVAFRIRELDNNTTNHAITQAAFIMDIEGYNLRQQGCFACLSIFLDWMSHTENYYPDNFKSLDMINTPRIFSPLLEILKPAMSPSTRKILHSHGPDKNLWVNVLLKTMPADQLPTQYGGTKKTF